MPSALGTLALIFFLSISAGLGALWFAPASWLDFLISRATHEQVRLIQAQGRLWSGTGILATELGGPKPLTQPLRFEIRPKLTDLGFSMRLTGQDLQWLDPAAEIIYRGGVLQIPAGQLRGPIVNSAKAPNALGAAQISTQLNLAWPPIAWSKSGLLAQGPVLAEFNQISSALAPIRPLGNLRVQIDLSRLDARPWSATSTEDSVIILSAQGELLARAANGSFRCQRFCDYLNGLLSLIGEPSGEGYVFSFSSD